MIRNIFRFIALTLIVIYSIYGQIYSQTDSTQTLKGIGNILWDMNMNEVEKLETLDQAFISYDPEVLGYMTDDFDSEKAGALLLYFFLDHRLLSAIYEFETNINDVEDYLSDFKVQKSKLIEKYGVPDRDTLIFEDESQKELQELAKSIIEGNLLIICNWFYKNGQIVLSLANLDQTDSKLDYKLEYLTNEFLYKYRRPDSD